MTPVAERSFLGEVSSVDGVIDIVPNKDNNVLSLDDYSRFKYGDGQVSGYFGEMMAQQFMATYGRWDTGEPLYITSSAYKVARPAAGSLVLPFMREAKKIAESEGKTIELRPFKIDRANLTEGDYAKMSARERTEIMLKNGLSLPLNLDLKDAQVLALDDVCVTGAHEKSIDKVLSTAGVRWIGYLYILNVPDGKSNPTLESALNCSAIGTIDDIIDIVNDKHLQPNARLGKHILSQSPEDIVRFSLATTALVKNKILSDIEGDGLEKMQRYKFGHELLRRSPSVDELVMVARGESIGTGHFNRHDTRCVMIPEKDRIQSKFGDGQTYLRTFRDEIILTVQERTDVTLSYEDVEKAIVIALGDDLININNQGFWTVTKRGDIFLSKNLLIA